MKYTLRLLLVVLLASVSKLAIAQAGNIIGQVKDEKGITVIGANVEVIEGQLKKGGAVTDDDGKFNIRAIFAGSYNVRVSYPGYQVSEISGVIVSVDKTTTLTFNLEKKGVTGKEVKVVAYKKPLIDKFSPGSTSVLTSKEIEKLPTRNTQDMVSTASPNTYQQKSGAAISIGGARSEGTLYIIDGVQVRGSRGTNLSQNSISEMQVLTSGISARYGDAIGGVINITTKGITANVRGGGIVQHSIDGYNNNLLNFDLSGPLFAQKVKQEDGTFKKKPLIGFRVGADYQYDQDNSPSYYGTYQVKDEVLSYIQQNPLRVSPKSSGGNTILNYASEYITNKDLLYSKKRLNATASTFRLNEKLDFQINDNTNLTWGTTFSYDNSRAYSRGTALLAPTAMPNSINYTGRTYLRFTQRFNNNDKQKNALISNAYYTVQADYQVDYSTTQRNDLKKDLFNYGYVGKFDIQNQPFYLSNTIDTATKRTLVGLYTYDVPKSLSFQRAEVNPMLANYTSQYFNLTTNQPLTIAQIRNGNGMLNGDQPLYTYGKFANVGYNYNGYGYARVDQFAFGVDASFEFKPKKTKHAIEFGLYYQQRAERGYSAQGAAYQGTSSGSGSIWQLMRSLVNKHMSNLDKDNPIFLVGGKRYSKSDVLNGVVTPGLTDTVIYNRLFVQKDQSLFDYNLRRKLGLNTKGQDFLNVDVLDPSTFNLNMFSPDELLNSGNPLVSAYGYDYLGNKLTGQVNFNDFFTKTYTVNGNKYFSREVGAFRPNYIAGYLLDKFEYKDMLFNVGLRVDRYDANTKVLKDPYTLYAGLTKDQVAGAKNIYNNGVHPSNIGGDYVVYVNDASSSDPSVIGYRKGDVWYDPYGKIVEDPSSLKSYSGGKDPQPFIPKNTIKMDSTGYDPNNSFTDYKPQINLAPRISFSFPISTSALFYAHYDLIVQRPKSNVFTSPLDYFTMSQNAQQVINNPDLKPEKLIDYEMGFQQKLTDNSALTLSFFYKERKDMIQVRPYLYAYPITYYTYGNRDFSTTKGVSMKYDLRRLGHLRMNLNYTLQFAEGTGSNANSANGGSSYISSGGLLQNFIAASLPNLRYVTPLSYDSRHNIVANIDYRYEDKEGPVLAGKHFLENAGFNLVMRARSGEPYTSYVQAASSIVNGGVNGSRLPWHFMMDIRFDKDFMLTKKATTSKGLLKQGIALNAFVYVTNLLNIKDVLGVYGYTGRTDDDGYLTSTSGAQSIANSTYAPSYIDLYNYSMVNPGSVNLPRRINIGINFNF